MIGRVDYSDALVAWGGSVYSSFRAGCNGQGTQPIERPFERGADQKDALALAPGHAKVYTAPLSGALNPPVTHGADGSGKSVKRIILPIALAAYQRQESGLDVSLGSSIDDLLDSMG